MGNPIHPYEQIDRRASLVVPGILEKIEGYCGRTCSQTRIGSVRWIASVGIDLEAATPLSYTLGLILISAIIPS